MLEWLGWYFPAAAGRQSGETEDRPALEPSLSHGAPAGADHRTSRETLRGGAVQAKFKFPSVAAGDVLSSFARR